MMNYFTLGNHRIRNKLWEQKSKEKLLISMKALWQIVTKLQTEQAKSCKDNI